MKVRIGFGPGGSLDHRALPELVDGLEERGADSLWLSEILTGTGPDPVAGLAWAAARSHRLKLGTTMLGPGRNPVRLAKVLADIDTMSEGRLLVVLVPGLSTSPERSAIGIPPAQRGPVLDDLLPLLRRLWAGETVNHHGAAGDLNDVRLARLPKQDPLEIWLGGMVPTSLRRCGRLADGWLPSACTPEEASAGKQIVDQAAADVGRTVDPEHFGISIGYAHPELEPAARRAVERRSRGHQAEELVPVGLPALSSMIEEFVAVGFSKFVVRPLIPPTDWKRELHDVYAAVGDLQT